MPSLSTALAQLEAIRTALVQVDNASTEVLACVPEAQRPSARNLLHYLVLRRHDLRAAQRVLAAHGLSSLGRCESHVLSGLDAVLSAASRMAGVSEQPVAASEAVTIEDGEALLLRHADALFGAAPDARSVRIMVTMPSEAASDYDLVRDLVSGGMDCMRINCAHDGPEAWASMITHLRRASEETGKACIVCMDIAGPKLRTGAIAQPEPVARIKPARNLRGEVVAPASVALAPQGSMPPTWFTADITLGIDAPLPPAVGPGTTIRLTDARGRRRTLSVFAHRGGVTFATLDRTAYLVPGTELSFSTSEADDTRRVESVPAREATVILRVGDILVLTPDETLGQAATLDANGRVLVPAQIGVTLPQVFDDTRPGDAIWFDDGRIGGVVSSVEPSRVLVRITRARPGGEKLGAGKGINLPDTRLRVPALSEKDREDLRFVVSHADIVGYSFVRSADDVIALQEALDALGGQHVGVLLKIETRQAFDALPRLLLAAMRSGRFGVMIARGDLAIECGYERMAEVQEEILWIAEAAHAPVVWATQVLESLAKTGVPSRAEVTDAAMAERAECVMLNKGPFIREAVRTLDDILTRMQAHQSKKRAMLRPLSVAHSVLADTFKGTSARHTSDTTTLPPTKPARPSRPRTRPA